MNPQRLPDDFVYHFTSIVSEASHHVSEMARYLTHAISWGPELIVDWSATNQETHVYVLWLVAGVTTISAVVDTAGLVVLSRICS